MSTVLVTLTTPMDWEEWDIQFQSYASALRLWRYIDPSDENPPPFLAKPELAPYSNFPASVPTPSTTTQSPRPPAQDGLQFTSSHPPPMDTTSPPAPPATSYLELSPEHKREYEHLSNQYYQQWQMYRDQRDRMFKLYEWIVQTVSLQYQRCYCSPEESLRTWYSNLRAALKLDDCRLDRYALDAYEEAIVPLVAVPTDFNGWLQNWSRAMVRITRRKLPHAASPAYWLRDFMNAVGPVKPEWATVYGAVYRQKVIDGTLDFHTVENDFRDEILKDAKRKRLKKGAAFSAAYEQEEI